MIEISQKTAIYLRNIAPKIQIYQTMQKKSSRGKYYVEETDEAKSMLNRCSGFEKIVSEYSPQ